MDNKIKQKSGFQKKIEKRAALLSAAGSDSKQRKLDFFQNILLIKIKMKMSPILLINQIQLKNRPMIIMNFDPM